MASERGVPPILDTSEDMRRIVECLPAATAHLGHRSSKAAHACGMQHTYAKRLLTEARRRGLVTYSARNQWRRS